jgi:hypothetical protein
MHSRNQAGSGGDALQKLTQCVAFFRREWRGDLVLEFTALVVQVRQQPASFGSKGHSDRAPVLGVRQPFGQPPMFEVVDDGDHGIAVDAEAFRKLPLRLTVGTGKRQQNGVRARVGSNGRQPALEVAADMGTQLRQEEWDSLIEFSDAGVLFSHQLRLAPARIVMGRDDRV